MTPAQSHEIPARTARHPFYFNTSAHLLRIGGERAATLHELMHALRICPDDSIFQHTFRTLEEHHFIREGFSNDFAHWAFSACDEPELAKRLAEVDVCEFTSVEEVRGRLTQVVNEFVHAHPDAAERPARERFYFCASDTVVLPTHWVAHDLAEFVKGLEQVTVHSIHHHFIEARLRLKLNTNDFSQWLRHEMGIREAARQLDRIDIYNSTLEEVRHEIIRIVESGAE